MTITNPPPKPFALATLTTDSGNLTLPCEPITEHIVITPSIGMDEHGNSLLMGTFQVTHQPSGLNMGDGSGCINCCRRAGRALAALSVDWSQITVENSRELSAAWSDEVKMSVAVARTVEWGCDTDYCDYPEGPTALVEKAGSATEGAVSARSSTSPSKAPASSGSTTAYEAGGTDTLHFECKDSSGCFASQVELGVKPVTVAHAAPPEWPPVPGDLWRDRVGSLWFAYTKRSEQRAEVVMQPADPVVGYKPKTPGLVMSSVGPLTLEYRQPLSPLPKAGEQA
ncbi:hypothetical protein [Polymorphospora lycopeni]|uniref:Uncharacterized protein n=1 Tax=Polymorphospora lycopeni TaxID=3140240 RepID=A0ABV5CP27_9ACTN